MSLSNLAYLLGSIFFALGTLYNVHVAHQEAPVAILEDEPGWNCEIHGNRICGPVSISPTPSGHAYVIDGRGDIIAVVAPERIGD